MKYLLPVCIVAFLMGCQKSEPERMVDDAMKTVSAEEMELVKLRNARNSCIRQNRINDTNVDCDAKFPLPKQ